MLLWTWVYKYVFKTLLLIALCIYTEVELLDHMVILLLIFWGAGIWFSTMALLFYIHTNNVQGFQFLHILAKTYFLCVSVCVCVCVCVCVLIVTNLMAFPGGSLSRESAYITEDAGLIPGSGRFPGGGHSNPLQYSCLENPMDTGAWWATIDRVSKCGTQWSNWAQPN